MAEVTNQQTEAKKSGTFQIIVFKQGTEEYALQIDQIKEVVMTPAITKMPQTPVYIKGVANVRGSIIAIIDLEEKFGVKTEHALNTGNYTLVVESDEYKMGILVKEVPNTLAISYSDMEQGVLGTGDGEQSYIKGIVKLGGRLIILIDIFKIMSSKEVSSVFQKSVAA
jgi:purine-binding chemotaxis protein CheW